MTWLNKSLRHTLLVFLLHGYLFSQNDAPFPYRTKVVGLPVAFYSPETRLGLGAAGFLSFKTAPTDTVLRPSQIRLGVSYTQEQQVLSYLSFDTWFKQNNYLVKGELGYYDFIYYFWGVGGEPRMKEAFTTSYPQIRLEGYRSENNRIFYGVKYTFDDYQIKSVEESGRLASGIYPGSNGGKISGLGISTKLDTRNDNFFPTQGYNIQLSYERFSKRFGSDFDYHLTWLNGIKYFEWNDAVIATNIYGRFIRGEAPFFHLSSIGGSNRMRGYYNGYYRDRQMIGWQAELRSPLWWRLRGVIFAGNAVVADNMSGFLMRRVRTTAGAGIRFLADRKRHVYIRLDAAYSKETSGLYFTVGEAF